MQPKELKKLLVSEGFQVLRIHGATLMLAERKRSNLIMDSGVSVRGGEQFAVRMVFSVDSSDRPGAHEAELFRLLRSLGAEGQQAGYIEVSSNVAPVPDPGNPKSSLDTRYEVTFEKTGVGRELLMAELRFALTLKKTL